MYSLIFPLFYLLILHLDKTAQGFRVIDRNDQNDRQQDHRENPTGGCVGGGGQPTKDGYEHAAQRGEILYGLDKFSDLRFSHENKAVQLTYEEFLDKPNSHRAHELLHTDLESWDLDMNL